MKVVPNPPLTTPAGRSVLSIWNNIHTPTSTRLSSDWKQMDAPSKSWDIPIGRRIDGTPWKVRVSEFTGGRTGPRTAFVGGVLGDKALGCLAVHRLEQTLLRQPPSGTVILIPALNLPAMAEASKVGSDAQNLNRSFPGRYDGSLTDQFAHSAFEFLLDTVDCVVDLHSGTPTMGLGYTYSYGNDELAASFGHLPVIVDHFYDGQLGREAARRGIPSILPEHGGGVINDPSILLAGCLNVLQYRGHLKGPRTGPTSVPLIKDSDLQLFRPSVPGLLVAEVNTGDIGIPLDPGPFARILDPSTGTTLESFEIPRTGGILLLAVTSPSLTRPGTLSYMVGFPEGEITVP